MKSTFEKMGGTYTLGADGIYYPNLVSTDEEPHYGKYGMMRKTYLKEHRPAMYSLYMLEDRLTEHLTQIAKDYGMSGRKFNALLHELGVQYKFRKTWLLYQQYAECGYTQSRTYAIDESRSVMHTYWTQKGRLFLYDLLKNEGILPVIEQED